MKTIIIISTTLALFLQTKSFSQDLIAENTNNNPIETSNSDTESYIGISLKILPEYEPNTLTVEFTIEKKGKWFVQLAEANDIVVYQQTGYGKGVFELDIITRKMEPGEYQIVIWSNDQFVIEKVYLNQ